MNMNIIQMSDLEIDDVTFLTSRDTNDGTTNKQLRSDCSPFCRNRRLCRKQHPHHIHCSFYQLLLILTTVIILLISIALLSAFATSLKTNQCHIIGTIEEANITTNNTPNHLYATNGDIFPWKQIRLPTFYKPIHYDLFMHPNLSTFINRGSVEISFTVNKRVDYIVLHSKQLNFTQISLIHADESIPVVETLENDFLEQLYIKLNRQLESHIDYVLKINFTRKMEEKLEGFYISSYTDSSSDKRKFMATTHFQATSARTAFPCFDEPALKATFSLKMVHEPIHDVYFNSEKQSTLQYDNNGLRISVFENTLKMSTYLVAFVVCDFKSSDARTKEGKHIRVLVPKDQIKYAELATNSAVDILSYFQTFFNITYPLSKLDLIAVPDFGAGAMENWGLMTFRTSLLVHNDKISSNEAKENTIVVISHEIAHQWFGNLVTMKWWNDIWLNEGFASYVENLGVDHLFPDWRMIDQFVISTTHVALAVDSLRSSHPIMANAKDPHEIEALFDPISYRKGASLIRMLQNFLAGDSLRSGLESFLQKYKFSNAETADLWRSFSKVVPDEVINVTSIMETWVKQKGYPVINVRSYGGHVLLTQKRFLSSPISDSEQQLSLSDVSPFDYIWKIPITYVTSLNYGDHTLKWMNENTSNIAFPQHVDWFKLNVNQTGYYRVNYDEYNWKRLISLLDRSSPENHLLSPTDRANLIDDAFALLKVDMLQANIALNITSYLLNGKEKDYIPWETVLTNLNQLDSLMYGHSLLRKFILQLIKSALLLWKDGWRDVGSHLDQKLRSSVYYAASYYDEDTTIKIAQQYFDNWLKDKHQPAPNFRRTVYTTGVRNGDVKEWDFCWEKYKKEKIPSEKRLLLAAMAHTRNPWLLDRFLNYSLDRNKIKPHDISQVITYVAENPIGRLLAWRFVRRNWSILLDLLGQSSFHLDAIISMTSGHFSHQYDYQEVAQFYRSVQVGSGMLAVEQTLERIRANIFWKQNVEPKVINFLKTIVN